MHLQSAEDRNKGGRSHVRKESAYVWLDFFFFLNSIDTPETPV